MKKTNQNLSSLIESAGFVYVSPNITDGLFPEPDEISADYKVFHINEYLSSGDTVEKMKAEGCRPANAWELVKYSIEGWNGKDWTVALGSVGKVDGGRYVPYLGTDDSERHLYLGRWDGGWRDNCRFLGVKLDSKVAGGVIESRHEQCNHEVNFCPACGVKLELTMESKFIIYSSLLKKGYTYAQIARMYKVTRQSVWGSINYHKK